MEDIPVTQAVKYLHSLDDYLKTLGEPENKLRQNLLQKARLIEINKDVNLPNKFLKSRVKCPKCCMPRDPGLSTYQLKKNKISKFYKKMKRKMDNEEILTKYQERYMKKHKYGENQLYVMHCNVCNYEAIEGVQKPEVIKKQNQPESVLNSRPIKSTKKNKMKPKGKVKVKEEIKKPVNRMQEYKIQVKKLNNMNALLSKSHKIKNVGLRDFIKSVGFE